MITCMRKRNYRFESPTNRDTRSCAASSRCSTSHSWCAASCARNPKSPSTWKPRHFKVVFHAKTQRKTQSRNEGFATLRLPLRLCVKQLTRLYDTLHFRWFFTEPFGMQGGSVV